MDHAVNFAQGRTLPLCLDIFTHNVPIDVPVFIVHSERVLLCLLGSLLDLIVFGPELTDDPHAVLGGSTSPLTKFRLPLVTLTLLLKQFL